MTYQNPRIDRTEQAGDPVNGVVKLDYRKLAWVSVMALGGTVGAAATATPSAVALFVGTTLLTLLLGHSVGMHRRFIHRAYECPKWFEVVGVHFGVLVGLGGPLGILRTHDTRDWAQRQPQCHNYFSHDEVWYRDAFWQLLCSIHLRQAPEIAVEPSIANDPIYQWMERTWMWQQLPWALLFLASGGLPWVFWGICARVTAGVVGHWLIGYFAHNTGPRRWHVSAAAVQGYNVRWCSLLTMGECWHNNHHAFPGSARLGLARDEWDPGWWLLRGLERLGLVWNLVQPESLPSREELRAIG